MILKQSQATSKDPQWIPFGAHLDEHVLVSLLIRGVCPSYVFWAFQQKHGIGWDFAERSKNAGE